MHSIVKTIKYLQKTLKYHEYLYHALDSPTISDFEYDNLKRKLSSLEKKYLNIVSVHSLSNQVGSVLSPKLKKIAHFFPMLSLENIFSISGISKFLTKIECYFNDKASISFCCELKIDGLALSLIYKHGILVRALTRGNGNIGEDVTINAFHIKDIPLVLKGENIPDLLEIRGEVFMLRSDFNKLNNNSFNDKKKFSNPRNLAAGSLRQTNFKAIAHRKLKFVCHGAGLIQGINQFESHYDRFQVFKKWGIPITKNIVLCRNFKEILYFFNKIELQRDSFDFNIDGIVIKVDSINYQKKLGNTAKFPRWAIALKFAAEEKLTKLINVHFQVGRSGTITPVGELKPVKISGVIIRKVSLHNKFEIKRLNLSINDTVVVRRSGEVIPYIVRVINSLEVEDNYKRIKIVFPKKCPVCNSLVVNELGSKLFRCTGNTICIAQIQKKILHFFSRQALNINGIGEKLVYNLINAGYVKNVVDFYKIDVCQLSQVENMGIKSATNIISMLHKSKQFQLSQFVYALGIRDVGVTIANNLSLKFIYLDKIMAASIEDLKLVKDVGHIVASNIFNFMKNKINLKIINSLLNISGIKILPNDSYSKNEKHVFFSKTIVITGSFKQFSRAELGHRLMKFGAILSNSLSKQTDILIVGNNPGIKILKASKLKTEIIQEKELLKIIKF